MIPVLLLHLSGSLSVDCDVERVDDSKKGIKISVLVSCATDSVGCLGELDDDLGELDEEEDSKNITKAARTKAKFFLSCQLTSV